MGELPLEIGRVSGFVLSGFNIKTIALALMLKDNIRSAIDVQSNLFNVSL
jgi:hypothetical protein